MFDWDDLRYLLAVARNRSTLAAGRALNVNQSTVHRRLIELERRIGHQLIKREPTGYRLTQFGEEMVPHAERVELAVLAFEQNLKASKRGAVGIIRLTCPEPIVMRMTRSLLLDRFYARHPGLRVEFVMNDKYVDLAKGDADVAIRARDAEDDGLVARNISLSNWAVYASRWYVERHGRPDSAEDLDHHALIGFDEPMAEHRAAVWLKRVAPNAKVVARNDRMLGLVYAVKSGIGIAPLPTVLGDAEDDLIRVHGPIPELARVWNLLTTPELRRTPHVSAFFDFMVDEIETLRPLLSS